MILKRLLLAGGLLLASLGSAKKSGPKISHTKFDHAPSVLYFDDSDTLLLRSNNDAYISDDAGVKWKLIEDPPMKGKVRTIHMHPSDKKRGYVLGKDKTHWTTADRGKTWQEFKTSDKLAAVPNPLIFHGKYPEKTMLALDRKCDGFACVDPIVYTIDSFKTTKPLVDTPVAHRNDQNHLFCRWAVSTPMFGEGKSLPAGVDSRIFCIVGAPGSPFGGGSTRLLYSDKYFEDKGIEAPLNGGKSVGGQITGMVSAKKYIVAAAQSPRTKQVAVYVTDDAVNWQQAMVDGHTLEEGAFTVLPSTNYSLQIVRLSTTGRNRKMADLFTSNSNGTYLTRNAEHLNADDKNYVDFENIVGIQGIFLVNTVKNWEDVQKGKSDKHVVSQISFDDGRTFQQLKAGDKYLHLHSFTEMSNSGIVFSSPAPGLVMGIGNTGDYLKDYKDGDLYVSDDAGLSWRKALKDAHKYEFGDQGSVLAAVYDEGRTNEISYSINHGKDWKKAKLDLPNDIFAKQLTTTLDSTSLKFLLIGAAKGSEEHYVVAIDFHELHERKCGKSDFEMWPARLNKKKEPDCLMGHKQSYRRRKADADCFIDDEFKDPVPEQEPCKCSEEDFECDFNFIRTKDGNGCEPAKPMPIPKDKCKNEGNTFKGASGFRLIPGNDCIRKGGVELDKQEKEWPCNGTTSRPAIGDIGVEKTFFTTDKIIEFYYLESPALGQEEDETVVVLTKKYEVFLSKDHGKVWTPVLKGENIIKLVPHPHNNDVMFFLTATTKAFRTYNRGVTFEKFETKLPPAIDDFGVMSFHPEKHNLIIWRGAESPCRQHEACSATAYYSTDRGEEWHVLLRYVQRCDFAANDAQKKDDKLIFCAQFFKENPKSDRVQLLSSGNYFDEHSTHFEDILDFRVHSEFIAAAARRQDKRSLLKLDVSVDGKTFADAQFPPNFKVEAQQAYTVLDSSTHSLLLHVTVNNMRGHEYGSLIKSNSNGTSFVLSLDGVNRNERAYADYEKMKGLEGVALANVVSNTKEADKGAAKKLKTMITHNDAAEWALMTPPKEDAEGRKFGCSGKSLDKCSLHLHAFTEKADPGRDTYSSGSAIGVMVGVGNVGETLTLKAEADTFITRNGGIEWHSVRKGNYIWEFGDQGSIIVIVPESKPTKKLLYTLDEGKKWMEFEFTDVEMQIDDISTVPSDTSLNFLLWGKEVGSGAKPGFATVNIDFRGLKERQKECKLNEKAPEADDYEIWEPKHPLLDNNCLFGRTTRYHRKKLGAQCYNGRIPLQTHNVSTSCECTRQDYECDYNFQRESDGSCKLAPGHEPLDPKRICEEDPKAVEYFTPTGYRRIPLTTCKGGRILDGTEAHACPKKEKEFKKKHPGIGGIGLFFAIVCPIGVAAAVGHYVYTHWDGKFGSIRLGESSSSFSTGRGAGSLLSRDSPLISIPVAIVAGTVAVLSALPLLATSLWRSIRGWSPIGGGGMGRSRPYSSRGAFAARRGDYVGVVEDEDELLGVDNYEEDEEDEV